MKQVCTSAEKDMEGWEDHTETTKLNEYTKMRKGQGQRTEQVQCKITKRTHPRNETQRCTHRNKIMARITKQWGQKACKWKIKKTGQIGINRNAKS